MNARKPAQHNLGKSMVDILHGLPRRRIPLRATRKYLPEEIMALCKGSSPPYYITVQNTDILVKGDDCLTLACQISAAYHNWVAYNAPEDDGFALEMEELETRHAYRDGRFS